MPTSVLGNYNNPSVANSRQQGFTLLELLVVLVVLAIATGMIVVQGTPSDGRYLASQAQKLSQILRIGQQQAMLTSEKFRFSASDSAFQFESYDGNRWLLVADEPSLRKRPWDTEGIGVTMYQDGQAVEYLTLEPQADLTQRALVLRLNQTELVLSSNASGQFVVGEPKPTGNQLQRRAP